MLRFIFAFILLGFTAASPAATIRVPQDYNTIQASIEAASSGDTVLVSPGTYQERIQLKPGIVLRSIGNDTKGITGISRAEKTVLDGGGRQGGKPGVQMAEGSTLDGFSITNTGEYDVEIWKKHFDSHGENLRDDEGSVQIEGTVAAVNIHEVNCTVTNNIVHHNGDVGIAVTGNKAHRFTPLIASNICFRNLGGGIGVANEAAPIIRENTCSENLRAGIGCRNSSPLILGNTCFKNIRAGIGCREGATPVVRGNKCYQNRRAGIGIRMEGTTPVVENNECFENDMAGIGSRDGAAPVIRTNKCYKNKMAGIGSDGSVPIIVGNECRENLMAGIGLRGKAEATIQNNKCAENRLVAIGVTQGSTATICGNQLTRTGGVPPIIAVKDGSTALIRNNSIQGGGVAAVLVQGMVNISDNRFSGAGEKQGNAIWVWKGSKATIVSNKFARYRAAVNASGSELVVTGNIIRDFRSPAIVIKDSLKPAHVFGNNLVSKDEKAVPVEIRGPKGVVTANKVKPEEITDGEQ